MPPPPDADLLDLGDDGVDIGRLGQTAAWGGLAALALFVAVLAARSETGAQRIAAAINGVPGTARMAAALPASGNVVAGTERDSEARRFTERLQALSADRDRLAARLEALERAVDGTGLAPPTPASATGAERMIPGVLPMPGPRAARATLAPPDSRTPAAEPMGQGSLARTPVAEMEDGATPPGGAEFAVDLGAGASLEELRSLWRTVKTQHGGALEGLRPLAAVRDQAAGPELRLVVGPVADAATAMRLCALIGSTGRLCRPGPFEGQRLALR